jgi:hypothetical protein
MPQHSEINPDDLAATKDRIIELAELDQTEYTINRKAFAEGLDIPVGQLDRLVNEARKESVTADSIVEELTPWPEAVDSQEIYHEIKSVASSYIVLPSGGLSALALWCMGTYAFDGFHIFPKLLFHSPEKRCGKSTALDVVEALSNRSLLSSNITPAALFRVIESYHPTLVIDEADTFIAGRNDDLIGIINSGHAKNRAFVIRTVGDDFEPKRFSTWSPQAFASIKRLQDTIMDRSVVIELQRKTAGEATQRIPANLKAILRPLRQKIMRWHDDNQTGLQSNVIEPPAVGNDRAVDNWLALFTIANSIGTDCLEECRVAYTRLNKYEDDPSIQVMLLEDIQQTFADSGRQQFPSEQLVEVLVGLPDRPWCEWKHGHPMTVNSLAKLLKTYSIKSRQVRQGDARFRCYEIKSFADTFSRYLSSSPKKPDSSRDTVTMASDIALCDFQPVTNNEVVTGENDLKPIQDEACHGVTGQAGENLEDDKKEVIIL